MSFNNFKIILVIVNARYIIELITVFRICWKRKIIYWLVKFNA